MQNPLIIANTKSYISDPKHFYHIQDAIWQYLNKEKYCYYVAVPSTMIYPIVKEKYKAFQVGSQNVDTADEGAYTGGTTTEQIINVGATFTLLGHSEWRERCDDGKKISDRVCNCLNKNLMTVLCVGEKNRVEGGEYLDDIKKMLTESLGGVDRRRVNNLVIAYEPVWAIGAIKPATSEQTLEAVIQIRRTLVDIFGLDNAKKIKIIYGGAVTGEGVGQFVKEGGVDGVLVGRACLDPKNFADIVNNLYEA